MFTNSLTLEQKICQLLMIGFRGTELKDCRWLEDYLENGLLGGVILFEKDFATNSIRNIQNPEQLKKLTKDLSAASKIPLFIAIDQEGGRVSRLNSRNGFEDYPSHAELGQINDEKTAKIVFSKIAEALHNLGINVNFAPVVDLAINPENKVVVQNNRCFSADPMEVAKFARNFVVAHKEFNVISVAKHFPGHGSSQQDSHFDWTDVTNTWRALELKPYEILNRDAILNGVMVGHIYNKNFDPNFPASLSHIWIEEILRKQIGFGGLVFTDDLQLKSISNNFSFEEAVELALLAGNDILLFANQIDYSEDLPQKFIKIVLELIKNNKISIERINNSFERIMYYKNQIMLN